MRGLRSLVGTMTHESPAEAGLSCQERLKGPEPSTFCMARGISKSSEVPSCPSEAMIHLHLGQIHLDSSSHE